MPDANFARGGQCHQLAANEEQILHTHIEIEGANVGLVAALLYAPQAYLAAIGNGNHFTWHRLGRRRVHLGINGDALDGGIDVRRGENLLPAIGVLDPIAGHEMRIGHRNPVLMCLDDLHAQRRRPIRALGGAKY